MSTSKKQYLTGTVHRLEDGVLKSYGPGDVAPDWVTNPKILTDKKPGSDSSEPTGDDGSGGQTTPAGTETTTTDDLDGLNSKELQEIAGKLGLKKTGSKAALTEAIRAKRAESAPQGDGDEARAALIEKLRAKSIEVDDQMSDAELAALDDDGE